MKGWQKKLGLFLLIAIAAVAFIIWYIFNDKFTDTQKRDSAFTVDAISFIKEFQQNDSLANAKYKEKIITVNGNVSEVETMDSTLNIKIIDTTTENYAIFNFQASEATKLKTVKEGDKISIKGSCSGGTYSEILEVESIDFKRCVINKQ